AVVAGAGCHGYKGRWVSRLREPAVGRGATARAASRTQRRRSVAVPATPFFAGNVWFSAGFRRTKEKCRVSIASAVVSRRSVQGCTPEPKATRAATLDTSLLRGDNSLIFQHLRRGEASQGRSTPRRHFLDVRVHRARLTTAPAYHSR